MSREKSFQTEPPGLSQCYAPGRGGVWCQTANKTLRPNGGQLGMGGGGRLLVAYGGHKIVVAVCVGKREVRQQAEGELPGVVRLPKKIMKCETEGGCGGV